MNHEEGGGASHTTEPAVGSSTATDVSLRDYFEALEAKDQLFATERDRRYTELRAADEWALQIKQHADDKALDLAKQLQDAKDEKANSLRTQIESERGTYATHHDVTALRENIEQQLKPITEFVARQQGATGEAATQILAASRRTNTIVAVAVAAVVIVEFALKFVG